MHAFWCIMLYIYTHTSAKKNDYLFALVYMVGWKGGATCIYIYIYDHICIYTYMIYVTWNLCVCVGSLRDFSPIVSSHSIMGEFPRLTSYSWVPPEAWVSMRWVIILSMCICRTKTIKTHVYIQWSSNIMCTIVYVYMVSPWFTLEKISRKYSEWRRWKILNGPNGLGRITINNLTKTPKWVGTAWNSKSSSGKQQTVTKVW